jgi:hypothetical protein
MSLLGIRGYALGLLFGLMQFMDACSGGSYATGAITTSDTVRLSPTDADHCIRARYA